jgi:hypothetical protein
MSIPGIGGIPPAGPSGVGPAVGRALVEALALHPSRATPAVASDSVSLQAGVGAAEVASLLEQWRSRPASPEAAAQFQMARDASRAGDWQGALHHLEYAILGHAGYAAEAIRDAGFAEMRGSVLELSARLTKLAGMTADNAIAVAGDAMHTAVSPEAAAIAGACLAAAEAQMQAQTYAGYLAATEAAGAAERLARVAPRLQSPSADSRRESVLRALIGYGFHYLRWQLPLLLVILIWFAAGVVGGVALLILGAVFPEAGFAGWRQTLMPVWGYGLLVLAAVAIIRGLASIPPPRSPPRNR